MYEAIHTSPMSIKATFDLFGTVVTVERSASNQGCDGDHFERRSLSSPSV